jgi:hypothetical protein
MQTFVVPALGGPSRRIALNSGAFRQLGISEYYLLLGRALGALQSNTMATRRVVYEMARHALVKQARAIEPEIHETDLTSERLKLEQAIRKIEVEELESRVSKKALIRLARHIETLLADSAR